MSIIIRYKKLLYKMIAKLSTKNPNILHGVQKKLHSRKPKLNRKSRAQTKSIHSQMCLPALAIDDGKIRNLDKKLNEIYCNTKSKFKNFGTFQKILLKSSKCSSEDLEDKQAPEEFTKQNIIEPLLEFLGFDFVKETKLPSPDGMKRPDYIIRPKSRENPAFYIEAKPLNTDLYSTGNAISQINHLLISKAAVTTYGIATDGFEWILIKYDVPSAKGKEIRRVNLRDVFKNINHPNANQDKIESIKENFLGFHSQYIQSWLENCLVKTEEKKEEISNDFYNSYIKNVFGYENGKLTEGICLQNKIIPPPKINETDVKTFSVIFMNRLIFIKFLEEKGAIVPNNLLLNLMNNYKSSGTSGTFYETYLKPLFYDVFNKSIINRSERAKKDPYDQISYLNGGLFRATLPYEKNYNIDNDGVELVIKEILKNYKFCFDPGTNRINPDILGYIFEKTINYTAGAGINEQKNQGAYYTPNDVVEFIIERTVIPVIFRKMIEGLKNAGWSETELKGYESIEDVLNNLPKNPKHTKAMIESIKNIKVLDLACGSGHFLTAVLSEILRVEEYLLRTINGDIDRYNLKKNIISKNIFGVDINDNAVEIARLRLWLSIIEEIETKEDVDTLPNIDFNIVVGNSLIGNINEKLMHPLTGFSEESFIKKIIESLRPRYGKEINEIENLLKQRKLEDTIKVYEKLIKIYTSEAGEDAVKIREILMNIKEKLYEIINNSYISFLHDNANLNSADYKLISKELPDRKPFHWSIDFKQILQDGGFDVIIGNPPYIEDTNYNNTELQIIKSLNLIKQKIKRKGKKHENTSGKTKRDCQPLFYASKECGNTYAYFIERSIKLLKKNGRFGFIVPISLISTERMNSIRNFITNNSCEVNYYNFDDRPGKIFNGTENCRATILITEKGSGLNNVKTSKYNRWFTKDRAKLFENLKTIDWSISNSGEMIPKISTKIEESILKKMYKKSNKKTIKDSIKEDGVKIWYYNAPRYWIHAHTEEYLPITENYGSHSETSTKEIIHTNSKDKTVSKHYKSLSFDEDKSIIINGLLNSSLFYWWFIIWGDGRDLLAQHIQSFPIDSNHLDLKKRFIFLVDKLMKNYEENSNIKINKRTSGHVIKIKEIIPSKSKNIIDQIDDVLADYYEFDENEKTFIKNFDIKFRMSEKKTQEQDELEKNPKRTIFMEDSMMGVLHQECIESD